MGWNWRRSAACTRHVLSLGFLGSASWIPWKSATPRAMPCRKKALLIGINYKKDLTGPQRDVGRMKRILIDKYHYKEQDIVVLTDRPEVCERLQPTQKNIMRELEAFLVGQKPTDQFFFMYAGHADQRKSEDVNPKEEEEDGMDERILPSDAITEGGTVIDDKAIMDDVLKKCLVDPLLPDNRLIAIFDACHSGTLLDLPHHRCNRVTSSLSRVRRVIRRGREICTIRTIFPYRSGTGDTQQRIPSRPKHRRMSSRSIAVARSFLGPTRRAVRRGREIVRPSHARSCSDDTLQGAPPRKKQKRTCSGFCPRIEKSNQYVLCISACKDSQTMYENNAGTSMCMIITDFLENDPAPTLKAFMRKTSERLEIHGKEIEDFMTDYEKRQAEWERKMGLTPSPFPSPASSKVFAQQQRTKRDYIAKPQISSRYPLRMGDILRP